MIGRILMGILWFVALYMGACMLTGAIAGGIAGSRDPANAYAAGQQAGQQLVLALRGYFLLGALVISVLGTVYGILPGTKGKTPTE
jgi:hypothetical protein